MFPREQRIRTAKDILQASRRGERSRSGPVSCSFVSKPGMLSRITVIADTKVSKKSVVRNLAKRRVRAILAQADLPQGDLVFRVYPGVEGLTFSELTHNVLQCLRKLRG